jgi:Polyketide cyclase / dehydrase and lipid transport
MKILKWILGIALLVVGIGFFMPGTTHLERTIEINAPSAQIYEQVNELKNWMNWSPWAKIDPNTVWKYSEPSSGIGSYYTWASQDKNVGNGKLTILEVKPNESVRCKMEFEGMGESMADFKFVAKDSISTKVIWSFDNDNGLNPIKRWFGIFMDKMLGPDYEKGLANLKAYNEMKK